MFNICMYSGYAKIEKKNELGLLGGQSKLFLKKKNVFDIHTAKM